MKFSKLLSVLSVAMLALNLVACGSQPKSANSKEAIDHAMSLQSAQEQANYILGEAKAFVNNKQYDEAVKSAQYVANNYQDRAQEAQKIIEEAQAKLVKMAEEGKKEVEKTADDLKNTFKSIGQ